MQGRLTVSEGRGYPLVFMYSRKQGSVASKNEFSKISTVEEKLCDVSLELLFLIITQWLGQ